MFEKQMKTMMDKFITEKIKNLNDEGADKYANANTIEAMFEKIGKKNAECFGNNNNNGGDDGDDAKDQGPFQQFRSPWMPGLRPWS